VQVFIMKFLKILTLVMVMTGTILLSVSCTGGSATPTPTPQIATVKRGNIVVSVTGTGNLALEYKTALSFGQTGIATQATTAKISEVDVLAGQSVKKDQVLVKADATDYQNQLVTDQHNLDSALAGVAQAQTNLAQAQLTLIQDQAALIKAQQALNSQQDVQNLQTQIDNANIQLQQAKLLLQQATATSDTAGIQYSRNQIIALSENSNSTNKTSDGGTIGILQKEMNNLLSDPAHAGASVVSSGANGVAQIQTDVLAVQQAQAKIVTDQANITNTQNSVVLAQNKVEDSQTTLTNDKNSAQEIDAPFDGLITQVTVTSGSIVQRNATLIEIAQPDKFVANIMVTEHDVISVKIGDNASVALNALTGYGFPAKITQIAPLATVQQGVVNYQVAVELNSTTPQGGPTQRTSTPTATPASGAAQRPPASPTTTPGISLKDGLSVVVTIPIQAKNDILLVPTRAISRVGQNSTVQKISGTTVDTVIVQTGLSDSTNTEIVSGLNEGDQVVLRTSTTATNAPGGFGGGGLRIP
jgi:multidrug efflux pump subunit AcrA (membrane-fusion protein)